MAGEHLWAVASLELPDPREEAAAVMAVDAVRLFLERAREATATFQFSDENATDIAELCRRLDGIPLAIELAAARVPALTPAEIRSHLDHRFKLLTGGRRSAVPRHQTLRSAVEWSYQLLDPEDRRVLERLSVFAGDFDLSAAQAVASSGNTDAFDVLDILVRLVAKSLVVADPKGGVTRYGLLETIREYAWEQLGESDDMPEVARCHAQFFAESPEPPAPDYAVQTRPNGVSASSRSCTTFGPPCPGRSRPASPTWRSNRWLIWPCSATA